MAYSDKQIDKIFKTICKRISNGEALRNIINKPETFSSTVFYEQLGDEEKNKQYTCAREERQELIFEQILEIADKQGEDIIKTPDGNESVNYNVINRNRLQIEARKWMLSKMNSSKYGDKVESSQTNTNINYNAEVSKKEAKEISDALENEC